MFCDWKWCRFFTLEQKAANNITGSESEYLQEQHYIEGFLRIFYSDKDGRFLQLYVHNLF